MTTASSSPSRRTDAAPGHGIDRSQPITITFGGQKYDAFAGDSLASALIAGGNLQTANSMYLDRPRGILAAGVEEPNGLVTVKARSEDDIDETMLPVTSVEATDGLEAFYVSGQGALDPTPDPALYDRKHMHADVLIVGAGPAGLAAARAALQGEARVVLIDKENRPGGSLLSSRTAQIDGTDGAQWAADTIAELSENPDFTYLSRTTAFGNYDSNYVIALQHRTDHLEPKHREGVSRQRVWHIRADQVVLAPGAMERPIVFSTNDRPGVMLAGAARTYTNRYGALPGQKIAVFTTNDSAYEAALDLHAAGAEIVALVDSRATASAAATAAAERTGAELSLSSAVIGTNASVMGDRLAAVSISELDADGALTGETRTVDADLLAVSGGFSPTVHLHTHRQGTTTWNTEIAGFVPNDDVTGEHCAGALTGDFSTQGALDTGTRAGAAALAAAAANAGFDPGSGSGDAKAPSAQVADEAPLCGAEVKPLWLVPSATGSTDDSFVDLQRDQAVSDIERAYGAGMTNIEHIKRYTSIGTANDQGKTSGVNAMAVLAHMIGEEDLGAVGVSGYRPPFTALPFAALAGRERGDLFDPARVTAIQPWHLEAGCEFEDVGQWKRPWFFAKDGEDMHQAVQRESKAVRDSVGYMDGTTLGKIEIRGQDAAEFVNRFYTNGFKLLKVGKGRYGVMCGVDGMIMDDGVTMRIADDRFLMTTTSSGAAAVFDWLEEWHQTEWPELDVTLTSVTEQYSTITVAGPKSRDVIAKVAPGLDVSNEAFAFMEFQDAELSNGVPARICRISFSGELSFEINVDAFYGLSAWKLVEEAGAEFDITPYGTETMHVLRAEKGLIIVGQDTDGTVTPDDAGLGWAVSTKKKHFIGKRSLEREDSQRPDRKQLVSVMSVDKKTVLPEGAQLIAKDADPTPKKGSVQDPVTPSNGQVHSYGFVTSSYMSPNLGRPFGLALIESGREREGEIMKSLVNGELVEVEIGPLCLFDPEGKRRDG